MKKKIVIGLIILAILAGTGVLLYLFVFKDNNMRTEQASNLVTRMAIATGAIEDFKGSPTFEDFPGSDGINNIINSSKLPSLAELEEFTNRDYSDKVKGEYNIIIGDYRNVLNVKGLEKNKLYKYTFNKGIMQMTFRTMGNEIAFIAAGDYETEGGVKASRTIFTSIFYDTKDQEFEIIDIVREKTEGNETTTFKRIKIGEKGFISSETYTSVLETGYKNLNDAIKSGTSTAMIYDFASKKAEGAEFEAGSQDNFILSSYVHQAYQNFETKLADGLKLINSNEKAIEIKDGKIATK